HRRADLGRGVGPLERLDVARRHLDDGQVAVDVGPGHRAGLLPPVGEGDGDLGAPQVVGVGHHEPWADDDPGPPPEPAARAAGPPHVRGAFASAAAAATAAASTASASTSAAPAGAAFTADPDDGGGHPGGHAGRRCLQLFDHRHACLQEVICILQVTSMMAAVERRVKMHSMPSRSRSGGPHGSPDLADPADPAAGPLAWAAARVGDRWTLLIVHALLGGPLRFGELAEALPGLATNVLSR